MKRRDARKQQIESNRVQMQEGIKQQLEERRKARAGRDIDGEMAVIDQETEPRTKPLMRRKKSSSSKRSGGSHGQKTIDDTTAGVQKTLDQMREEARIAAKPVASRQKIAPKSTTSKWQLPSGVRCAVETANAAKPQEQTQPKSLVSVPEMPTPLKSGA